MNTGSRSKAQIIRSHTITYFNILNLVLAALVVISGQYKNMLFMGIVIFNSLIGIIQELKVKSLIDKLSVITATKAKRIKGEEIEEIPISQIQKEDCLLVTAGDQIVADCTVLTSDGLEVNESLLTGESVPVLKKAGDTTTTIYSDSRTAQSWVRKGAARSTLEYAPATAATKALIDRADLWLHNNRIMNPIVKWDTEAWGEIPADFGRK